MVYTQTQVANEVGIATNRFWSLVNYRRLVPKPTEAISENRKGYSESGLAQVKRVVSQLRKNGIVK